MMPTRVNPSRSRNGASNRVACGCAVGTLLLSSLLVVLVLSSASVPANQGGPTLHKRSTKHQSDRPLLSEAPDKPPNPPIPSLEELSRPQCATMNKTAMVGAPPCEDPGNEVPATNGSATVALMFLVKDKIPTEPIWSAFMASAAELTLRKGIPPTAPKSIELLQADEPTKEELATKCWGHGGMFAPFGVPPREKFEGVVPPVISNVTGWLQENCFVDMTPRQHYELQDLFTVYVHRMPGVAGAEETSLFYQRDIENRIRAEFAQPSLVGAYRRLLEEALKDPRNTMFVLISETCIPLHHPALFYSQLMAESHISRVSSGVYNPQRWFHLMSTDSLKSTHFQKGDQWLTLTRMHAELVSTDTHVWSQFQRYCRTQMACWQPSRFYGHVCISDEHYVPTLFAAYGLNEQRDQIGITTFTDWMSSQGSWHPKTFHPGNALEDIYTMRRRTANSGCPKLPHNSLRSAASVFQHTPICNSAGDKIMPLQGPNYADPSDNTARSAQRRLSSHYEQSAQNMLSSSGARTLESSLDALEGADALESSVATAEIGGTRKLTAMPEFGPERDRSHWDKAQSIRDAMRTNLREYEWLGGFEPMQMHCPLLGRRIEWQSVSEFASLAWRCDGLGFSWECLHAGAR